MACARNWRCRENGEKRFFRLSQHHCVLIRTVARNFSTGGLCICARGLCILWGLDILKIYKHFTSFVWASSWNHSLAALDLGAGVEQPFNCLIVQHRQAMQSVGRSMDRTLENNIVDGLFFCATLTGRRGGHTPFLQAGAETSDTGAGAVKLDPGCSLGGSHRGCGGRCKGWKCGVL